jgi:hypothetical protein
MNTISSNGPRPVRVTIALTMAAGAVVLSLMSLGVAIFALGRAGSGTTAAAAVVRPTPVHGNEPAPATGPPAADPPTVDPPTPAGSSHNPSQNPGEEVLPAASYTVAYEKKGLTLQVECGRSMPIDLDEPRLGGASHELAYDTDCGPAGTPTFLIASGTSVARAPATASNAADCAEAIRSSLLGADSIAVTADLALCVRSSRQDAATQGISQKIVLVQVRSVNSSDVADVLATAWNVPG